MSVRPKFYQRGQQERGANKTQMQLAKEERKKREDRLARETAQTKADFDQLTAHKRLTLRRPAFDPQCDNYDYLVRQWVYRCKRLMDCCRESTERFDWRPDWMESGVFYIQPRASRKVA